MTPEFVEPTAPAPEPTRRTMRSRRERKRRKSCVWPAPRRAQLEKNIQELLSLQGSHPDEDLLADMVMTTLRLIRDGTNRGELKIMAAALRELRYGFSTFSQYADSRKISVFGSARTRPSAPEYKAATRFSEEMARRGFMVITGAGGGIMEAANGGAGREKSFGMNIRLPFEQLANPHIDGDPKLVSFRYFFTRKLCFVKEASAIALFPGGFGTHDEGYEALTLIQTGKASIIPVVFIDKPGGTYWRKWADYVSEHLLGKGLISEEDMSLFRVTDDIDWAADHIVRFYKRYHSSRWVKGTFVIRMLSPLPRGVLKELNREFKSILADPKGKIATSGPLPEEKDQPELADLPRLVLPFNRRNCGELRKLIDVINRD